jgi:hypothetical protein
MTAGGCLMHCDPGIERRSISTSNHRLEMVNQIAGGHQCWNSCFYRGDDNGIGFRDPALFGWRAAALDETSLASRRQ